VDKKTKNNLYMHRVSVFIITYSSIETLASIELTFGFDWMNSQSKQPSIELTRYHAVFWERHLMISTGQFNAEGNHAMEEHPIQGGVEILLVVSSNLIRR